MCDNIPVQHLAAELTWILKRHWVLNILWQSLRHSLTNCSINLCGSILFIRGSDGSPRSASNLAHEMSVCSYHCHVNQFNGEGWKAASPQTARAKPARHHIHTPSPPPSPHWGAKWWDRTVTGFVLREHEGYDSVFSWRVEGQTRGDRGEKVWYLHSRCLLDTSVVQWLIHSTSRIFCTVQQMHSLSVCFLCIILILS